MSTTVYGIAGLDDCGSSKPGSCKTVCGTPCNNNAFQCAWPYFNECQKQNCAKLNQTDLPWGGGCYYNIDFGSPCGQAVPSSCIHDCGPCYGTSIGGYCPQSTQKRLIACINTTVFNEICGFCNPIHYGIIYVSATVYNASC